MTLDPLQLGAVGLALIVAYYALRLASKALELKMYRAGHGAGTGKLDPANDKALRRVAQDVAELREWMDPARRGSLQDVLDKLAVTLSLQAINLEKLMSEAIAARREAVETAKGMAGQLDDLQRATPTTER
jgi:hypothetical protein